VKPKLTKPEAKALGLEIRKVRKEKNQSVSGAVAEANLFLMRYGQEGKVTKNDWTQMEQYGVGLGPVLLFIHLKSTGYLNDGRIHDCLWDRLERTDARSGPGEDRRRQIGQDKEAIKPGSTSVSTGHEPQGDHGWNLGVGEPESEVPGGEVSVGSVYEEDSETTLLGGGRVPNSRWARKRKNVRKSHGSRGNLRVQVTTGGVQDSKSTPVRNKKSSNRRRQGRKR